MATFKTPKPEDVTGDCRCLIVYVPRDREGLFLAAFLGNYSKLARPFVWDGNLEYRDYLSQLWLDCYTRTVDSLKDDICDEITDGEGNVAINVNVNTNCGGGGGGDCSITIPPYNPGPSVCFPVETTPIPFPEVPPLVRDDNGNILPPEPIFPDDPPYTGGDYDADRCALAELAWVYLYDYVKEWKRLDDIILTISAVLIAIYASGATGFLAIIARLTPAIILELVANFIQIADAVDDLDVYVDDILQYLEDNKNEFICGLYTNLDQYMFMESFGARAVLEIMGTWRNRPDFVNTLERAFSRYLELLFIATPIAAIARLNRVAGDFVSTFPCDLCTPATGVWTVDSNETQIGQTSNYTLEDTPNGGFVLDGTFTRASNTGYKIAVYRADDMKVFPDVYRGIAFSLDVQTDRPDVSVSFGTPGNTINLTTGPAPGPVRYLIHDGTMDGTGFDAVIVAAPEQINPEFQYGIFGYQPPASTAVITVDEFVLYPL